MNLLRNMIPLDSECIKAAGWSDGRLAVRFPSGKVKFYEQPVTVFQRLMEESRTGSAGKFYNRHIKKLSGCCQSGESVRGSHLARPFFKILPRLFSSSFRS